MEVTFKLNSDEDDYDSKLNRLIKVDDMAGVLWEIKHNFYRRFVKHSQKSEEHIQGAEEILEAINELLYDRGINVDALYC